MAKHNRLFLFSYYGGKSKIAHLYPHPLFDTIVEPFAGAANYSCYHFKHKVVLFEKNPVVFGVLDFLVKSSEKDILALPLLEKGQFVKELKICEEARNLIGFRIVMGAPTPQKRSGSYAADKEKRGIGSSWNESARYQLSHHVNKIKHWKVVFGSCWDAFEEFKNQEVTWFIDPPYQGKKGKVYPCGSQDIEYAKLQKKCLQAKGQVIVCEGEEADWLSFCKFHFNEGRGVKRVSWEMIWTKGCKKPMGFGL